MDNCMYGGNAFIIVYHAGSHGCEPDKIAITVSGHPFGTTTALPRVAHQVCVPTMRAFDHAHVVECDFDMACNRINVDRDCIPRDLDAEAGSFQTEDIVSVCKDFICDPVMLLNGEDAAIKALSRYG